MSGGIAYVYDEDGKFAEPCNTSMVTLERVLSAKEQEAAVDRAVWHKATADEVLLRRLIEDHHK